MQILREQAFLNYTLLNTYNKLCNLLNVVGHTVVL